MLAITIGLCAVYVMASVCIGSLLTLFLGLPLERIDKISPSAALATAFLLGQGGLATVWLLLALAGWFWPGIVAGLLTLCVLGGGAFAWPTVVNFARQFWTALSSLRTESLPWRILVFLTLLLLLVEGVNSARPPTAGSDAEAFYMALPKVIAASHRLVPLRGYETYSQIGLQGEFHYAALMSLGSPQAAKLFVWPTGLAVAMVLVAIGSEAGLGRRGKWIVLAVLYTSTGFTLVITDGKVDLFGAAMGMAAFYWALQTGERHGTSALRLTGLFVGLAVIGKLSYAAALVPGILLLVIWQATTASEKRPMAASLSSLVKPGLAVGFWMMLPFVPHLLKNGILFGEPLAPFLSSGGQSWLDQTWFSPEVTRWIVMTYPLALVFGNYPMQYGNLSPLILAFAPLSFLLPRPRSIVGSRLIRITLAAALGMVIWLVLRPSVLAPRYILAPLLVLIPAVARGAEYVTQLETKPRWLSGGILTALFIIVSSRLSQQTESTITTLLYEAGQYSDCGVSGGFCTVSDAVNREAAPGDRVFLGTYSRYWLRPDLMQCVSGASDSEIYSSQTPEAAWAWLFELGFRYVILYAPTHAELPDVLDLTQVPAWLTVVPLFDQHNYTAFRLESNDPSRQPRMTCRQVNPPAWDVVER